MSDQLYKGFRPDEMEYQFNPRESVPEYPELAKVRAAQAKKVRETAKSWLNISYGNSPRELLDIYTADKAGGPVLVYIHGSYWRSGSKENNCKSLIARIVVKVRPSNALRSERKSVSAITFGE
jgi:acetyl esterase/lipase